MSFAKLGVGLIAIIALTIFSGCHYFKISASVTNGYEMEGAFARGKSIIVHTGNEDWQLIYPILNKEKEQIEARFMEAGPNHQFYRFAKKMSANRYPNRMGEPGNDVNIYVSEFALDSLNQLIIPLSAIKRMDVYQKETGRTVFSYIGCILGGYYGLMIFIALLSSI